MGKGAGETRSRCVVMAGVVGKFTLTARLTKNGVHEAYNPTIERE